MGVKRVFILIMFVVFLPGSLFAQLKKGEVEVIRDPLISVLQKYRSSIASGLEPTADPRRPVDRSHLTKTVIKGFRVQIFMGADRNAAYAEQARFQQLFKDIETYVTYEEPNYRVKVGDFQSRREAERMMQGLRGQFSNVFIFTEDIFIYQ